jgi:hypothetical protein
MKPVTDATADTDISSDVERGNIWEKRSGGLMKNSLLGPRCTVGTAKPMHRSFCIQYPVEVRQGRRAGALIGFLIGPRQSIIALGLFGCIVRPLLLLLLATDEIISAHLLIYGGE